MEVGHLSATRPDLIYSVSVFSRYMESLHESHASCKTNSEICKRKPGFSINYKRGGEERLVGFVDSDYPGGEDDI